MSTTIQYIVSKFDYIKMYRFDLVNNIRVDNIFLKMYLIQIIKEEEKFAKSLLIFIFPSF